MIPIEFQMTTYLVIFSKSCITNVSTVLLSVLIQRGSLVLFCQDLQILIMSPLSKHQEFLLIWRQLAILWYFFSGQEIHLDKRDPKTG